MLQISCKDTNKFDSDHYLDQEIEKIIAQKTIFCANTQLFGHQKCISTRHFLCIINKKMYLCIQKSDPPKNKQNNCSSNTSKIRNKYGEQISR